MRKLVKISKNDVIRIGIKVITYVYLLKTNKGSF